MPNTPATPATSHAPHGLHAPGALRLLRASLIAVCWLTVAASLIEWNGQSLALLRAGGVPPGPLAHALIGGGVALDIALALALTWRPTRATYALTALAVLGLTLAATALLPALWLHPIGPLSKNLPILAILFVLYRSAP
ncbi:DoxX-like family protein [Vandammella animalimorsus]|uniref:Epimerase n=1 Tax=Vandammella animalimorsus TaxID=2029117 RepID=A0A2A2AJU0_9BURK|nr:DoxX-like family protein [Vandammella animalimorsus]PAT38023.1 epimerase [Vandammella animalimorsus]